MRLAITAGFGYTAPLYVGAGILLTSVIVMAVAAHQARSHQAGVTPSQVPRAAD
ncbi:hypothetical protein Y717_02770 [Streptomyces scopuliridis RB72]|uniref:Uncharacterized protein n=1 Tax=Streptomyces scopuliridis RB72 TaxID=1440053 RepID=A0A2T7T8J5_9ACTN|nr:hypothetical protein Y717_02770 [Streptomyces scopuliridis RB72]